MRPLHDHCSRAGECFSDEMTATPKVAIMPE